VSRPAIDWRRLLVEPGRPVAIRNSPHAPWLVVSTVCVGAFMGQLDASIVTLAFPSLQRSFDASLGSVQWVGLAYMLTLIALLPAIGRAADMRGRKLLYTYGFAIFTIGSALCGVAPSLDALIGFRVIQGVGAAMLQANSVAIIVNAMPPAVRAPAIGVQGAAQALGLALGPAVGGLLIGIGGWRLIFLVNIPAGVLGVVLGWFLLPRSQHLVPRTPFDWPGLALFVPAVGALLLALSYGNELGWGSGEILGLLALSAALVSAFVRRERRTEAPLLDPRLFARPAFSAGIASGLMSYLVLFGVLLVVPFLLEEAHHLRPGAAGLLLMVMPLGLGLAAPMAGRLSVRVGVRPLAVGGMVLVGCMLVLLAAAHDLTPALVLALAGVGVGLGAFTPTNNAAIMASAPLQQAGVASGVLNMTRGLGTSLGLALTGLVFILGARGHAADPARISHAFVVAVLFLAAVALLAALLAALRGRDPGSVPAGGASGS
jgi:EmrB/QacA subfamily drug resistance transporter